MTPQVRLAQFADAEACERLDTEARQETAGARGAEAFFAEQPVGFLIGDESGFSIVAEVDDVVVGFATIRLIRAGDTSVASIVRIYVTARARRVGIGDALIAAARDTARTRGCQRIDAMALPGDRDTKNLYERNGLTARLIVATSAL